MLLIDFKSLTAESERCDEMAKGEFIQLLYFLGAREDAAYLSFPAKTISRHLQPPRLTL